MLASTPCMKGTMKLARRCSIAGIAQFYPRKHPDNWWLLLCCVVAYAICTAALNLFLLRFEGEVFFFTQAKKVHKSVSSGQQQLHLSVTLPVQKPNPVQHRTWGVLQLHKNKPIPCSIIKAAGSATMRCRSRILLSCSAGPPCSEVHCQDAAVL